MGMPVVTVAAGGMPVVEVAAWGMPVTEAAVGRGAPVTKVVGKPGLPVTYVSAVALIIVTALVLNGQLLQLNDETLMLGT